MLPDRFRLRSKGTLLDTVQKWLAIFAAVQNKCAKHVHATNRCHEVCRAKTATDLRSRRLINLCPHVWGRSVRSLHTTTENENETGTATWNVEAGIGSR